ncbi:MAG: M48 family metallopeptidase [bacterium]
MQSINNVRTMYEQQSHNKRMSMVCFVGIVLLFASFGLTFDLQTLSLSIHGATIPFPVIPPLAALFLYLLWSSIHTMRGRSWYSFRDTDNVEEIQMTNSAKFIGFLILLTGLAFYGIYTLALWILAPGSHFIRYEVPIGNTFPFVTLFGAAFSGFYIAKALAIGPEMIFQSYRVRRINEENDREHRLLHIADEMSIAAGISRPALFIIEDTTPNAFAVGIDPSESSIVLTTGLLTILNRSELQGVIAHEVSHIKNHDVRLMTIITVLYGSLLLFANWSRSGAPFGGSMVRQRAPLLKGFGGIILSVIGIVTSIFAPLIVRLLALAISRQREYLADATAAELTRNPEPLSNALLKLERGSRVANLMYRGIAHLCIVDPLQRNFTAREGFLADWFSTHPPTKNRIIFLDALTQRYREAGELQETKEQPVDEFNNEVF